MEGRPTCACHGVPMYVRTRQGRATRECAVKTRERSKRRYDQIRNDPALLERKRDSWRRDHATRMQSRRDAGVCLRCSRPRLSDALCWRCLNKLEERRAFGI